MLEVGTIAPAFTLSDQYGNPVSLSEYRGRKVVLYFYPRDNTPRLRPGGCRLYESLREFQIQRCCDHRHQQGFRSIP